MGDRIRWIERLPGYHYHDTPEGDDCLKKAFFLSKVGLIFGVGAASVVIVSGPNRPIGVASIAARYARFCYPPMAVGATFGAATCVCTNIRGVDDEVNYFWGGVAAGTIAGACARSGPFGTLAAFAFGALAAGKKTMEMNGLVFLQDMRDVKDSLAFHGFSGPWGLKYDTTLTLERERGWKKSEDE